MNYIIRFKIPGLWNSKDMKKLILLMILSLQIITGFGQTPIQGIINSNTSLTKNNSPYLVTGDLVVFPKWKLTIEPDVKLRFASNVKLQIRGTLVALGTEANPILFIPDIGIVNEETDSDEEFAKNLWQGIEIMNTLGGNASFDYCKISHALTAIKEEGRVRRRIGHNFIS